MTFFHYLWQKGMIPEVHTFPVPTRIWDGKVVFEDPHHKTFEKAEEEAKPDNHINESYKYLEK